MGVFALLALAAFAMTGQTRTGLTPDDALWIARLIVAESGDVRRQSVDHEAEWNVIASVAINRAAGRAIIEVIDDSWNKGLTPLKLQRHDEHEAFRRALDYAILIAIGEVGTSSAVGFAHTSERPSWATSKIGRMWVRYA
jgi:hypothetical protein